MNSNVTLSVELFDVYKMRLDQRSLMPRRRSSKTGSSTEKDENSLHCAPSLDSPGIQDENKNDLTSRPLDSLENIDRKSNCWEPKLSKEESNDIRHLKELLMLNLDLIKQQQDLLQLKEKQLIQAKDENNALKCRLERMERRMSLLKSGSVPQSPEAASSQDPTTYADISLQSPVLHETTNRALKRRGPATSSPINKKIARFKSRPSDATSTFFIRKAHRKTHLNRMTISRRKTLNIIHKHSRNKVQKENQLNTTPRRELRARTETLSDSPQVAESCLASPRTREKQDVLPSTSKQLPEKNTNSNNRTTPKHKTRVVMVPKDNSLLKTDTSYYVPVSYNIDPVISENSAQSEEVLVPTFRIKKFIPYYVIEGTENFDDEVYAKRHQKHEAEERKRKRWDLQRQRELEQLQKLQQGRGKNSEAENNFDDKEDDTFVPDPYNIKFIEVCNRLPVNVFGSTVPKLENREFDLPWFDVNKCDKTEQKKKSRKR